MSFFRVAPRRCVSTWEMMYKQAQWKREGETLFTTVDHAISGALVASFVAGFLEKKDDGAKRGVVPTLKAVAVGALVGGFYGRVNAAIRTLL